MAYDNTNRGVLFINDKKEDGDKKPDRTGSLNVDGVEYFLDGWIKKSESGKTFMSISVKRKDKQTSAASAAKQTPAGGGFDDLDSDFPF